jgi:hypothetical protein
MFPSRRITTMGSDSFRDKYSLYLDGTSDTIRIDSDITISVHDANFSWAFWAKREVTDVIHTVMGHTATGTNYIRFTTGGSLVMETNTNTDTATGTLISNDTNWHHYVISSRSSDGTIAMYQDGQSMSVSGDCGDADIKFRYIGGQGSSGTDNEFRGYIADLTIYNTALYQSHVGQIYNHSKPYNHSEGPKKDHLTHWWRFGDYQPISNHYHMIPNNATAFSTNPITESTFDSDADGWTSHSSGTVSHSTTIAASDGSSGVLKSVSDASSHWFGKSAAVTSGMETGKFYIMEGFVYVPSSWSGTSDIYFSHATTFGSEVYGINHVVDPAIKDKWQYTCRVFLGDEASGSGYVYLRASNTNDMEADDFIYLSAFALREITNTAAGMMQNFPSADNDFVGNTPF